MTMTITLAWWFWPTALTVLVWVVGNFWPEDPYSGGISRMVSALVTAVTCAALTAVIWVVTLGARLWWVS